MSRHDIHSMLDGRFGVDKSRRIDGGAEHMGDDVQTRRRVPVNVVGREFDFVSV